MEKINKDWLTRTTGDPFADTGGHVIEQLWNVSGLEGKSILELVEYIANIYVLQWGAGQLSPFFLNSKITQPAFKNEKKILETNKFYKGLIEESLPFEFGYCRILGEKTKLFIGARDNHLLSGSGTFINFHHSFQGGIMLSKEILIRMFFVPFGAIRLSEKIAVLNSNKVEVSKRFVSKNVKTNLSRIGSQNANSVLTSEYNNPYSALFEFVHSCIANHFVDLGEEEKVEIQLYHFTNFGASPEVILYNFSSPLFSFYQKVLHRTLIGDWKKFVRKHYYNSKHKNFNYNPSTDYFESDKKKPIGYEGYKTWINWIYQDLVQGKNILRPILKWTKEHSFNFKIVRLYQNNLKNMDNKTLDKIEELANYLIENEDKLKKRISTLNKAERVADIRRFLLKLVTDNHNAGNAKVLITLNEYVNYLFPDGASGKEIRDLLLIAVYQKMHDNKIFFDEPIEPVLEQEN